MKNTYKIILGSAFAIAIIGGAYVNRPRIEVTAEATANATSTVIVPTSTRIVSRETSSTTADVATSAPQITYVYKETVRDVQAPTHPVEVIGSAGSMIEYVPTPIFTTPTVIVNPTPVVVQPAPIQEPAPTPTPEPVIEPTVEPEAPFFSEYPRYWIEERVNGRWIFFQATWSDGSKGKIVCNGKGQENNVRSGLPSIVEEKNLADQITGGSLIAEGRYVSCTFTVGSHGGVTANITVE